MHITLTDAERVALQGELARLQAALEEMITGNRLASVSAPGGRGMGFAKGDPVAVRARIAAIRRLLGMGGGRRCLDPRF